MEYNNDSPLFSSDAIALIIAFIVCIECAKEQEYRCENCDKVYKQEARYRTHIAGCIVSDTQPLELVRASVAVTASDFSELLRQNREMIELMRKQQETIQLLVAGLVPLQVPQVSLMK